jgi:HAD superfamily hydrolase (TIGR01548 family)
LAAIELFDEWMCFVAGRPAASLLLVQILLLQGIDIVVSMTTAETTTTTTTNHHRSFRTLLLDMDGVLAEVSRSYRAAIVETCHHFGACSVDHNVIAEAKTKGNANDDWKLSHSLIMADPDGQKDVTLEQVTAKFETLYQGTEETDGLYKLETLIPMVETLRELRKRSKTGMGIVTGRPRRDCEKFLRDFQLTELFAVTYCMEDGPSKPDHYPVTRTCELLGVTPDPSVVLVGDTPDDIRAAVAAGCTGVGVVTPDGTVDSPLVDAMKSVGAVLILSPGLAELVAHFASDDDE